MDYEAIESLDNYKCVKMFGKIFILHFRHILKFQGKINKPKLISKNNLDNLDGLKKFKLFLMKHSQFDLNSPNIIFNMFIVSKMFHFYIMAYFTYIL